MQYFAAVMIICGFSAAFGFGCTRIQGFIPEVYRDGEVVTSDDSCEICRCTSGVILCEPVSCPSLGCLFGQIKEDDGCCPKCRESVSRFGCWIIPHWIPNFYPEGAAVPSGDKCRTCRCISGEIHCEPLSCPAPMCLFGLVQEDDQCCPKCPESENYMQALLIELDPSNLEDSSTEEAPSSGEVP